MNTTYKVPINEFPVLAGIFMELLRDRTDGGVRFDGVRHCLRDMLYIDEAIQEVKHIPHHCEVVEKKTELTYGICSGRVKDGTLLFDADQLKRLSVIFQASKVAKCRK